VQETRQNLDSDIAAHIAADNDCFIGDSANIESLKEVFHNVMIINPSIEVYLLDREGKILTFYAPDQIIKIDYIPLEPIKKFISEENNIFITGIDPKNPEKQKTFSAAKVYDNDEFKGYMYVILGGQEYENVAKIIFGSYILRLGIRSMLIVLITSVLIGLISIGVIIRNVRKIVSVIREFKNGNLDARIHLRSKSELLEFANSFNEMADTIVSDMEKLNKKDKLRRDLAANISHDLRTPLSIVRGYAETIQLKGDILTTEERVQYMENITKSVDRLLLLVNELFELSKLEAQEGVPEREVCSLGELVQDIHQKNQVIAREHKQKLVLNMEENPYPISADISMMEKMIQNLLDNAYRHTPEGGEIEIGLSKEDDRNLVLSVSDTGSGIDEDQIEYIFNRYYSDPTRQTGGAGIGLSIVKKIVDLHGFDIRVESEKQKGTRFVITIPEHD
jgi:signal transduction histidine kinase